MVPNRMLRTASNPYVVGSARATASRGRGSTLTGNVVPDSWATTQFYMSMAVPARRTLSTTPAMPRPSPVKAMSMGSMVMTAASTFPVRFT